jgi:metalloendopeptidase OMA1, mitochondrial
VLVVGSGVLITVKYGNLQNVPYTKRKHLLLWSNGQDRMAGDSWFENRKFDFKEDLLPEIHPESVRVRIIAYHIFDALKRELSKKNMRSDDLGKSRKKVNQRQSHQACTSHLDGLNWDILVVNDNTIANAYSFPNGKVMVFTGLLEHLTSDEIAVLIAHEVLD